MSTNYVQPGKTLDLTIANTTSGMPVCVGQIVGVAETDTDAGGKVRVATEGVYTLLVNAVNGSGNSAIAIGDKLYYVTGDTIKICKKDSGVLFGLALGTAEAGESTESIDVKLV